MTEPTTQALAELRRLAEAAKGWRNVNIVKASSDDDTAVIGAEMDGEFYPCVDVDCDQYYQDSKPFADYLAAMNAHGIELLDALEAQAREIERLKVESTNKNDWLVEWNKWEEESKTLQARLDAISKQEPVAWQTIHADGFQCQPVSSVSKANNLKLAGSIVRELYASPVVDSQGAVEALEIADALRDGINSSHDYTDETERAEKFLRAHAHVVDVNAGLEDIDEKVKSALWPAHSRHSRSRREGSDERLC